MSKIYTSTLQSGATYHVYNQGNNGIDIFKNEINYHYFLNKYKEAISPYVRTFAFCLLPNHFHFLIQVKNYEELHQVSTNNYFPKPRKGLVTSFDTFTMEDTVFDDLVSSRISKRFANFFSGYTRTFNKAHHRKDKLFALPFKRLLVEDEFYFENLIGYIHRNPIHHGLVSDYKFWKYSSYFEILENWNNADNQNIIDIPFIKDWFETKTDFIQLLKNTKAIYEENGLYLE